MKRLQAIISAVLTRPLQGKVLIWSSRVRLFTDGGQPVFLWKPRLQPHRYHPHWGMRGWVMTWLGRQIFLTLGEDRNNLYATTNRSLRNKQP